MTHAALGNEAIMKEALEQCSDPSFAHLLVALIDDNVREGSVQRADAVDAVVRIANALQKLGWGW